MSDKNESQNSETSGTNNSGTNSETNTVGQDLLDELGNLGSRFSNLAQTAWQSDERKQLEQELRQGVESLAENLETGFRTVKESEQAQTILNKAEEATESINEYLRSNQVTQEFSNSLVQGLRSLSKQMDQWASDLNVNSRASATQNQSAQNQSANDDSSEA